MKNILTILGSITLIGTTTTSLVACNTPQEYTPEELEHLKKENQIDTKDETIKNNLEWIAPQEKPFNEVDNKWYYVVWRGNENEEWYLSKFNNNTYETRIFDWHKDTYCLMYRVNGYFGIHNKRKDFKSKKPYFHDWQNKNDNYFKSVYRWNLDTKEPDLIIDNDSNIKVNGE